MTSVATTHGPHLVAFAHDTLNRCGVPILIQWVLTTGEKEMNNSLQVSSHIIHVNPIKIPTNDCHSLSFFIPKTNPITVWKSSHPHPHVKNTAPLKNLATFWALVCQTWGSAQTRWGCLALPWPYISFYVKVFEKMVLWPWALTHDLETEQGFCRCRGTRLSQISSS